MSRYKITFDLHPDEIEPFLEDLRDPKYAFPFDAGQAEIAIRGQYVLAGDVLNISWHFEQIEVVERWRFMLSLCKGYRHTIEEKNDRTKHSQYQSKYRSLSKLTEAISKIIRRG